MISVFGGQADCSYDEDQDDDDEKGDNNDGHVRKAVWLERLEIFQHLYLSSMMPLPDMMLEAYFSMRLARVADCLAPVKK